jgi:TonB-dependent starch-binding outer membrane protein SusC
MKISKLLFSACLIIVFTPVIYSQTNALIIPVQKNSDTLKLLQSSLENKTGEISTLDEKEFNESACKNTPLQLVQNKLTGLMISVPNNSDPTNTDVEFAIRGINSLLIGYDPVYLIDGIPGSIHFVAPQDIKSISLLRDLPSSNNYGTFGSGPLIMIETKKATSNKLMVNYSTILSVEGFAKYPDMMTAHDFVMNANISPDYGYVTDWFSEIMQTGYSMQHHLSAQGGIKNIKIYGSFTFRDMEGEIKKSANREVRGIINASANAFDKRLNIDLSGRLNSIVNNPVDYDVIEKAMKYNPTDRPFDDAGNYTSDLNYYLYYNPVNLLNESALEKRLNNNTIIGSAGFKITDNWSLHTDVSFSGNNNKNSVFRSSDYQPHYSSGIEDSTLYRTNSTAKSFYIAAFTDFYKTWGKHAFGATMGIRSNDNKSRVFYDDYEGNGYSFTTKDSANYRNTVIFGKLSYSFTTKYVIDLSFSKSSNSFLINHNAVDPSVSFAWLISNENFLRDNRFINNLKLRTSYGTKTLALNRKIGNAYSSLANGIKDEKISELNIGIDWALLGNRLCGTVDYYNRKNPDVLGAEIYLDGMGSSDYLYNNIYSLKNKGIEIGLQAIPVKTREFTWMLYFNYSLNKNEFGANYDKMLSKYSGTIEYGYYDDEHASDLDFSYIIEDGHSMGNIFGYKSVDINESGEWIIENSDGEREVISYSTDRRIIGNGIPKFFLGVANTIRYRNFDFGFNLRGAFGFQIIDSRRLFYENPNILYNKLKSSTDLVYGKARLSGYFGIPLVSYYVEDGDYLKIDNLSVGYTTHVNKYISSLRFCLSAENVFTFTKYKGVDPEVSINNQYPGLEYTATYPSTTIFSLGINADF